MKIQVALEIKGQLDLVVISYESEKKPEIGDVITGVADNQRITGKICMILSIQ